MFFNATSAGKRIFYLGRIDRGFLSNDDKIDGLILGYYLIIIIIINSQFKKNNNSELIELIINEPRNFDYLLIIFHC